MKILLSGGSKTGKSALAQKLARKLAGNGPMVYAATMIPCDEEDRERIRRHIREREGWGFVTIECGHDLCGALGKAEPGSTVLLDSVTAYLSNEMFDENGKIDYEAPERAAKELLAASDGAANIIFVSDYIYCDGAKYSDETLAYMEGLARIDKTLARYADAVYECSSGLVTIHKGEKLW